MPDMEKLTVNVNAVDLGQIELLVAQGFYANRTEFIRVAIHDQLTKHAEVVRDASVRQSFVIGAMHHDRRTLEESRSANRRLALQVDIVEVEGFVRVGDLFSVGRLARRVVKALLAQREGLCFLEPCLIRDHELVLTAGV